MNCNNNIFKQKTMFQSGIIPVQQEEKQWSTQIELKIICKIPTKGIALQK